MNLEQLIGYGIYVIVFSGIIGMVYFVIPDKKHATLILLTTALISGLLIYADKLLGG